MPLVRIDLREGKTAAHVRAIGEAVHRAMGETLGVPERDRFQIINEHAPEHFMFNADYLDVQRTDDLVIVQVFLSAGRTKVQKQAFYTRLAALLKEKPGLRPQDVMINLIEDNLEDWSFGNGEAQYVILPKDHWK
jgi:4-oxalocrotonate tautomerase